MACAPGVLSDAILHAIYGRLRAPRTDSKIGPFSDVALRPAPTCFASRRGVLYMESRQHFGMARQNIGYNLLNTTLRYCY